MSPVSFPRPVRRFSSVLVIVAGTVLLGLGILTVADVLSRNLQGQSILGAIEISTLLLVAVAFFGLAAAEIDGRHVSVSLVEERLGRRGRMAMSLLRAVLVTLLGVLLVYGMFGTFDSALERGETTNDVLRLPTWPAKLAVALSFLLFFILAIWKEILTFRALRAGEDVPTSDIEVLIEQTEPVALGDSRDR
ncbi:TRAP transporter small permease protein [Aeromicrobium sp. PE09-221]|uniref:TRAP transporter small permease subunit n=1 Tax=Aeromicrobium sp. PE09-221 TaxID=1898043 RepID=UPI000B3ED772|nr:TRAP transporter small permease [Aeromicrobium sp. PE09-221]OUZ12106.1 TRAP transporter small permease protein [Aeromicrobium sp. PE09-221]